MNDNDWKTDPPIINQHRNFACQNVECMIVFTLPKNTAIRMIVVLPGSVEGNSVKLLRVLVSDEKPGKSHMYSELQIFVGASSPGPGAVRCGQTHNLKFLKCS